VYDINTKRIKRGVESDRVSTVMIVEKSVPNFLFLFVAKTEINVW
jgi:hypothetical protein